MAYDSVIDAIWIIAMLAAGFLVLKFWPGRAAIYRKAAIWGLAGMEAEKARAETRARKEREFGVGGEEEVRNAR